MILNSGHFYCGSCRYAVMVGQDGCMTCGAWSSGLIPLDEAFALNLVSMETLTWDPLGPAFGEEVVEEVVETLFGPVIVEEVFVDDDDFGDDFGGDFL